MDFFNKAIEQAKQLQSLAADALQKGVEQAHPIVKDAVAKAQDLQKTLIEQAPNVTAAAQVHYNAALQHAGTLIATGKTVLEAGTSAAQQHLSTFSDQASKAADAARSAVHAATAPKQSDVPDNAASAPPPNPPPQP